MYPAYNPYAYQQYQNGIPTQNQQNNMLPPMKILEANGKASIDALKLSPDSSVLIADTTAPIVWRCVSDSLGNVTATPWDISPHKTESQIKEENMGAAILDINARLKRLEEEYGKSIAGRNNTEQSNDAEYRSNKASVGNAQRSRKPASNVGSDDAE